MKVLLQNLLKGEAPWVAACGLGEPPSLPQQPDPQPQELESGVEGSSLAVKSSASSSSAPAALAAGCCCCLEAEAVPGNSGAGDVVVPAFSAAAAFLILMAM